MSDITVTATNNFGTNVTVNSTGGTLTIGSGSTVSVAVGGAVGTNVSVNQSYGGTPAISVGPAVAVSVNTAAHAGTHATGGSDRLLLTPDQIDTIGNENGALYFERYSALSQWMSGVDDALLTIDSQLGGADWQGFWNSPVSYPIGSIVVHQGSLWRRIGVEGAGFEPGAGDAYWVAWFLTSRLDAKAAVSHFHHASHITSGTISTARLATGAASATTFLRGDQTWAAGALLTESVLLDGGGF